MSKLARVVASLEPRHKLLAKKSGLSEERIREIARGDEPQVSEVISLSKALSMPLASLMDKGAGPEQVEFRFRTAAKAKAAESPFYVEDMASRVSGFIEIISCADVSEESRGWRQQVPTGLSPESLASWCRAALLEVDEVSPIPGLPRILANKLGFVVAEVGYPEVEGASAFIDEVPFIFVSRRFAPRMLFTVAHELGHLLVHHGAGDFVAIDRRQGDERARVRGEEGFADQFASAILLPAAGVGVALRVLRESYEIDEDAVGDIELL